MNGWVFTGAHRNGKQVWRYIGAWIWSAPWGFDCLAVQPEPCR